MKINAIAAIARGVILSVLLLGLTQPVFAVPGAAEPAFAPSADGPVSGVALQGDGQIVVVGEFTHIGGQPRNQIARLSAAGTVDMDFDPDASGPVSSVAVQADGKIVIGGDFASVGGEPRDRIARLHADGTLDMAFNPDANGLVASLTVQPDGRILVGGAFTGIGGQTRNRLARLHSDGTLDTSFNPNADDVVRCIAVQADGKILVGGTFTRIGIRTRNRIARLNANGTLDLLFNPNADGSVRCMAVQGDGRILLGGEFTGIGVRNRNNLARIDADGRLDMTFDPNANGSVLSLAVQTDGRIIAGGEFTRIGGQARNRLAQFFGDGTLVAGFDPDADQGVHGLALQPDGRIVVTGGFTRIGGQARSHVARLDNEPATQKLAVLNNRRVKWVRGGASPEAVAVTFELSIDGGATWSPLGGAHRLRGNWQKTGLALPDTGEVRARAWNAGGTSNGSSIVAEAVTRFFLVAREPFLPGVYGGGGMSAGPGNFGYVNVKTTMTKSGDILFTGSLVFRGFKHGFKGTVDMNGAIRFTTRTGAVNTLQIARTGLPSLFLMLDWQMVDGVSSIILRVTDRIGVWSFTAARLGDTAVHPAMTGKYTAVLWGDVTPAGGKDKRRLPKGHGYATVNIGTNGTVKVRGNLGDGTAFTSATTIDAAGSFWIYAGAYARTKRGAVTGQLAIDRAQPGTDLTGTVEWFKPAQKTKLYPKGFHAVAEVTGSAYIERPRTAADRRLLAFDFTSQLEFHAGQGRLRAPVNVILEVDLENLTTPQGPVMLLKFSPGTGKFSGRLRVGRDRIRAFGGVVLQKTNQGAGTFRNTTESGYIELVPFE